MPNIFSKKPKKYLPFFVAFTLLSYLTNFLATQPLPMFSVASNTTTNTNIPGIEQSQLEAQENSSSIIGRPPRSRQPVVIPLTKTSATADFNNSLTKNTSSYAYSNKTYSSKNIYKGTCTASLFVI